ncbi:MAG: hypothetical protein ACREMN_01530 [Gemmatimonadales bacterium]
MLGRAALTAVITAIAVPAAAAQGRSTPSDTLLAGVTARGRLLAAYDQAAWHATDAVLALVPESTLARVANTMVALQQADRRWTVLFGQLTASRDSLLLRYEARPTARPDSFTVVAHTPAMPLLGNERRAAVALHMAMADVETPQRPYNAYVLPRADSLFWVYFLPAQVDHREFPHGADVRYVVDPAADSIIDEHPMHRTLLNLALPDSAVAGLHTVLVDNVPQDSDVFLVLVRRPRRPELIATENYDYEIAVDGTITWRVADRRAPR